MLSGVNCEFFQFDVRRLARVHSNRRVKETRLMIGQYASQIVQLRGGHGDYHQVTDEPQYIDYTKLRNVAQLVHDIGIRVANLEYRLVVDGHA